VVDLLPDLDRSLPHVLGGEPRAVGALAVRDNVLDLKDLLEDGRRKDLLLDRQLDPDPLRVRLRPYERGVYQPDF
jgi:hypothetical protein